jgi:hypothetical protein
VAKEASEVSAEVPGEAPGGEAAVAPSSAAPADAASDGPSEPVSASRGAARARRRFSWWWVILAALVVEFWIYGRRGYVEVCVGKTGETDFSLTGPRDDANRWKFPRCETRNNLGLVSKYDQAVDEATAAACRGATVFRNQGQGKQCAAVTDGWERRIDTRQTPPWHPEFYEHLFWFLK